MQTTATAALEREVYLQSELDRLRAELNARDAALDKLVQQNIDAAAASAAQAEPLTLPTLQSTSSQSLLTSPRGASSSGAGNANAVLPPPSPRLKGASAAGTVNTSGNARKPVARGLVAQHVQQLDTAKSPSDGAGQQEVKLS